MAIVYLTVNKFWPPTSALIDEAVHDVIPGGRDKDRMSDHSNSLDGPTRRNSTDGVQRFAAAGTPGEKDKAAEEEGRFF